MKKLMIFTGTDWAEVKGSPGKDGRTPVAGVDFPLPKDGKDASPLDPQTIIDAVLAELVTGKRLKPEHVSGVSDSIKSLNDLIAFLKMGGFRGGGGSSSASVTIYSQTPVGLIDGSNTTYTVLHTITNVISFAINGAFIHPADYTVLGQTITFTTPLDVSLSGLPFTVVYS